MLELKAYAKINLFLAVIGMLPDGYHSLVSVVLPIDLADTMTLELNETDEFHCNIEIPDNVVLKVLKLFRQKTEIEKPVRITLNKNIPIGAGLGGESSDIAAALKGLNALFGDPLNDEQLAGLAGQLGSDATFFMKCRPAIIRRKGEIVEPFNYSFSRRFTLIIPDIRCNTVAIFKNYKFDKNAVSQSGIDSVLSYLQNDERLFFQNTYNDLGQAILESSPELRKLYEKIKRKHPISWFTGSGSAIVFPGHHNCFFTGCQTLKVVSR